MILSDLDGTVIDSSASVIRAFEWWADLRRLPEGIAGRVPHGRTSTAAAALLAPHLDAEVEGARLDQRQCDDTEGVVALPGALELLETHARLAIVTSCPVPLAHARLAAAGLPRPAILVTPELTTHTKPDPEPYLLGARLIGAEPRECGVLEDAPAGVAAGLRGGDVGDRRAHDPSPRRVAGRSRVHHRPDPARPHARIARLRLSRELRRDSAVDWMGPWRPRSPVWSVAGTRCSKPRWVASPARPWPVRSPHAGALGMLCEFGWEPNPDRMSKALLLADGRPVGMGFFGHWIDRDLETFELAAGCLRVVELFWSVPDAALVTRARRCGDALVAWQIGSRDDAMAAQDSGCDFVVAQGVEAGGHVRGTVPRDELLEEVLASVSIPVVIAGGIASAEDVASAIAAGADGVRVGTAFIATPESGAHPAYVDALLRARSGADTVLTTAFGRGWPDAPHRVLASALAAADALSEEVVGEAGPDGARYPIPRFSVTPPSRDTEGHIEAMALYAGTGVGRVSSVRSAADVVAELVAGLDA